MDLKDIEFPAALFVTGIGTDVGKSFATGWLAKKMNEAGKTTITQKMIQTGNTEESEDIVRHRKIMGIPFLPEDEEKLTAPIIYSYPCSPHLAAKIDGETVNTELISKSTELLLSRYPHLLIEGAGGLMVPLKDDYLTIDYISDHDIPVVLVVTGQLGSINHILLSVSAIQGYGLKLFAVVYNPYFDKDETICSDTRQYLREWLTRKSPETLYMEMPVI